MVERVGRIQPNQPRIQRVQRIHPIITSPRPTVSLRRALTDPGLLGNVIGGPTWLAWRVLLIAAMGESLRDDERVLFTKLTGREREPSQRVEELVGVIGRRGGKSRAIACLACYIAGLTDHHHVLAPGERGVALCIAPDQRQATIILDYAEASLKQSPVLCQLIKNRTSDALSLTTGINIEVRAASFRRLRGPTYVAVIGDEIAFFYLSDDGSANSDTEILDAVRPGLATTNGLLAVISSPYAKRGELFELHRRHYGAAGDPLVLVAQGESRLFNPSLPQSVVDRAMERDPQAASAEFLALFRSDIENFINREQVQLCVDEGTRERAPLPATRYLSFTDPSGGSSDSMVTAIGHVDGSSLVIDAVREILAPFDPESAVEEIATLLASYRIRETVGDRYSAQWVAQSFEKRGIKYKPSEQAKSQLYLELLPRLNGKTIRLLDHPRSINQICLLERRTSRGGRDSIDHPVGAHDDIANTIAGLCGIASRKSSYDSSLSWVSDEYLNEDKEEIAKASKTSREQFATGKLIDYVGSAGGRYR